MDDSCGNYLPFFIYSAFFLLDLLHSRAPHLVRGRIFSSGDCKFDKKGLKIVEYKGEDWD